VQAAFEVAEEHGDGLDALLVGQVLQRFADLVGRYAAEAVALGLQIQLFQLLIAEGKKIAVLSLTRKSPFRRFDRLSAGSDRRRLLLIVK
jgi:hypothetical protein